MEFAAGKIILETRDRVARLTINNAERRNAINYEMWLGVEQALDTIEQDHEVRVAILAGAGSAAFASGGDLKEMHMRAASGGDARAVADRTTAIRGRFSTISIPVIAQVSGYCIGGGLALAMATDIRIAGESSVFAVPVTRLGNAYNEHAIAALVSLVGSAKARELMYTGSRVSGREAERIGLVNHCVADDQLEEFVSRMARTIAAGAPLSVVAAKIAIAELSKPISEQDKSKMDAAAQRCHDSNDFAEGRAAFLEKREPNFGGN